MRIGQHEEDMFLRGFGWGVATGITVMVILSLLVLLSGHREDQRLMQKHIAVETRSH